jgi:hypothetical protein
MAAGSPRASGRAVKPDRRGAGHVMTPYRAEPPLAGNGFQRLLQRRMVEAILPFRCTDNARFLYRKRALGRQQRNSDNSNG